MVHFFSVIVPTCNRPDSLQKCLNLLVSQKTENKFIYEIIVSDDSQDSITEELVRRLFAKVIYVRGPRIGPAANRNRAVEISSGNWLVFIDDDCLPDLNWLFSYYQATIDNDFLVFEGMTTAQRSKQRFDEESPLNLDGGNLWSCNFCISRELFFLVGKFDEKYPYPSMEDTDLFVRICKIERVLFISNAIVIHPWRRVHAFRVWKKHLMSHVYFRKKHCTNLLKYRISRFRIFIGYLLSSTRELYTFSGKGFGVYIERNILNLMLIFF